MLQIRKIMNIIQICRKGKRSEIKKNNKDWKKNQSYLLNYQIAMLLTFTKYL